MEAVEAAARAIFGDPYGETWALQTPSAQERAREDARLALESAAPYIAGAWHDAVSEAYVVGALSLEQASVMWAKNPYRPADAV